MPETSQLSEEQQSLLLIEAMRSGHTETLEKFEKSGIAAERLLNQTIEQYATVEKAIRNQTIYSIIDNEDHAGHAYLAFPDKNGEMQIRGFYPVRALPVIPGEVRNERREDGRLGGRYAPPGHLPASAQVKAVHISQEGLDKLRDFYAKEEANKGADRKTWVWTGDNCIGLVDQALKIGGKSDGIKDLYSEADLEKITKPVHSDLARLHNRETATLLSSHLESFAAERALIPHAKAKAKSEDNRNNIRMLIESSKKPALARPRTSATSSKQSQELLQQLKQRAAMNSGTSVLSSSRTPPASSTASEDRSVRRMERIVNQLKPEATRESAPTSKPILFSAGIPSALPDNPMKIGEAMMKKPMSPSRGVAPSSRSATPAIPQPKKEEPKKMVAEKNPSAPPTVVPPAPPPRPAPAPPRQEFVPYVHPSFKTGRGPGIRIGFRF